MTVLAAACGSANKRRARSRIRMLQPPKSVRPIGYYDALLVCVYMFDYCMNFTIFFFWFGPACFSVDSWQRRAKPAAATLPRKKTRLALVSEWRRVPSGTRLRHGGGRRLWAKRWARHAAGLAHGVPRSQTRNGHVAARSRFHAMPRSTTRDVRGRLALVQRTSHASSSARDVTHGPQHAPTQGPGPTLASTNAREHGRHTHGGNHGSSRAGYSRRGDNVPTSMQIKHTRPTESLSSLQDTHTHPSDTLATLAVHKRKVADVRVWLTEALDGTPTLAKYRVRG